MLSFLDAYLEDYAIGASYEFGEFVVSEEDIVDFAKQFDPQYFHVDPCKAQSSQFGGLIASGWHTCAIMMRLLAEHYISRCSSLGSPGVDKIRWLEPVRPGNTLRVRATIIENRLSRSKPDRGIVKSNVEVVNQEEIVVLTMETTGLFLSRGAP